MPDFPTNYTPFVTTIHPAFNSAVLSTVKATQCATDRSTVVPTIWTALVAANSTAYVSAFNATVRASDEATNKPTLWTAKSAADVAAIRHTIESAHLPAVVSAFVSALHSSD